jgi:hypothetical protein
VAITNLPESEADASIPIDVLLRSRPAARLMRSRSEPPPLCLSPIVISMFHAYDHARLGDQDRPDQGRQPVPYQNCRERRCRRQATTLGDSGPIALPGCRAVDCSTRPSSRCDESRPYLASPFFGVADSAPSTGRDGWRLRITRPALKSFGKRWLGDAFARAAYCGVLVMKDFGPP